MKIVRFFRNILVICGCLLSSTDPVARCDDWPHWRGPLRNGNSAETSGFQEGRAWPRPEPLWKRGVGEGGSSPIVVGERVFTLGWQNEHNLVRAHHAATGELMWEQKYPSPRYGRQATGDEGLYSGPSGTPEYDAQTDCLFTLGGDGDLHCWKAATGELVWRKNLYDAYAPPQRSKVGRQGRRDYGYTTAPLVHGDWVLVEVGDDEGLLMAFDKRTGERIWASQSRGEAGHTGGLTPLTVDQVPCVAVMGLRGLVVARLDAGREGKTVAEYPWITDFANNVASPTAFGNRLLITSGYNKSALCCLEISLASGARKIWEQPVYSLVCSPVVHGDRVYFAWQQVHCLDLKTGNTLWKGGKFGDAGSCIATADDRLLVWGGQGRLALVEIGAQAKAYRELASLQDIFSNDCWPHVAFSNGRIFVRDREGNLRCYGT